MIAIYGKMSAYTADEQEAFIAIVNQVSVALQNVELIERERSRVERLAVLNDMSRAMSAVLDMDELLHRHPARDAAPLPLAVAPRRLLGR